ncbi:MAG: hypothetical protein ACK50A_12640 [Sphingobacteriaceae bacterium]
METKLIQLFPEKENLEKGLQISGELFMSGCSLFGTEVCLFENGILKSKYICCANGYFYFLLDYNKRYTIEINKENFESKSVMIHTHVLQNNKTNRHFEFGVMLHRMDESEMHKPKPIPLISYSEANDRFEIQPYANKQKNLAS